MLHHGVAHDQLDCWRQLHAVVFEGTTIEQQRMARSSMASYELIHDADARSDEVVLGLLTPSRQFRALDGIVALLQQREAHRDLDSR